MSKREQLYQPAKELRVQTSPDGSKTLSGYAIVFNSRSVDLGGFTEYVTPGAVTETLRSNPDVVCLRDHKQELLMGRTKAGTLTLTEDSVGLRFLCKLPSTSEADSLAASVERGDLDGVSFGFVTVDDNWTKDADGKPVRALLQINLAEISPTSFAAYPAASVSVRSCPKELRGLLRSTQDEDEDSDCGCDCPECEAGDHADCTGEPGECDEDEDRSSRKLTRFERTQLLVEIAHRRK